MISMSQLIYSGKSALIQNFVLKAEPVFLRTNAHEMNCYVCKKGLEDGTSLTAKTLDSKNVMLCEKHFE
jgi:hypothetical protein|tara:strand:- start:982 stop:1188 length:207 start_codon:yes stop_codon:yes gene_type:complete